jgi:hypothetical protein
VRRDDDDVAVDEPGEQPAVRERDHGRRVDQHVVVLPARFRQQFFEPGRCQHLVGPGVDRTGKQHRDVQRDEAAHRVGQRVIVIQDRLGEPAGSQAAESQAVRHRRAMQVGVDDQHAGVGRLRERAGQVESGDRLAFGRARTGDRKDLLSAVAAPPLDDMPQRAVLVGFARGGRGKADERLGNPQPRIGGGRPLTRLRGFCLVDDQCPYDCAAHRVPRAVRRTSPSLPDAT